MTDNSPADNSPTRFQIFLVNLFVNLSFDSFLLSLVMEVPIIPPFIGSSARLSKISYWFIGKRPSCDYTEMNTPYSQRVYGVTFMMSQRGKELPDVDGHVFNCKGDVRTQFCCKTRECQETLVPNRDER